MYSKVSGIDSVVLVDEDYSESYTRSVFTGFENGHFNTKVVMGTPLLSCGLDCKAAKRICFVDCSVNCVDYMKMAGRIRDWGYVKVLRVQSEGGSPHNTDVKRETHQIDRNACISVTLANFNIVPFKNHNGCCGVIKADDQIEDLKRNLAVDRNESLYTDDGYEIDIEHNRLIRNFNKL